MDAYSVDTTTAGADLDNFVEQLRGHGVLREVASAAAPTPLKFSGASPRAGSAAPVVHVYTDLQELLLFDPIHEVDPEAGWPNRPT